jgi:hypothetical protein
MEMEAYYRRLDGERASEAGLVENWTGFSRNRSPGYVPVLLFR